MIIREKVITENRLPALDEYGSALPAMTVAAHVTHWGNRPMHFACSVAMSGRFGMDLDLAKLPADLQPTPDDKAEKLKRVNAWLVAHVVGQKVVTPATIYTWGEGEKDDELVAVAADKSQLWSAQVLVNYGATCSIARIGSLP